MHVLGKFRKALGTVSGSQLLKLIMQYLSGVLARSGWWTVVRLIRLIRVAPMVGR